MDIRSSDITTSTSVFDNVRSQFIVTELDARNRIIWIAYMSKTPKTARYTTTNPER